MSDKYDQLKKNMKHLSATYSPGILVSTMDGARIAITDLQEEIESLKAITELAKGCLRWYGDEANYYNQAVETDDGKFARDGLSEIARLQNAQT